MYKYVLVISVLLPFILRWLWKFNLSRLQYKIDPVLLKESAIERQSMLQSVAQNYPHLRLILMSRKMGELLIPLGLIVLVFAVFSFAIRPVLAGLLYLCVLNAIILLNWWASAQEMVLLKSQPNVPRNSQLYYTISYLIFCDSYPKALWLGAAKRL